MTHAIHPSGLLQRPAGKPEPKHAQSTSAAKSKPLEKSCRDFEAIFVNLMLQQMRQTVPQDGLLDGGRAEEIYTSMMDDEVAKAVTQQRGMGLASMLYRQLSALSESGGKVDQHDKSQKNP
jgi:peptidoglycan hydrolase FlgJ